MASKGVIQNRLSQPLGSKYLSATDHTEVNCTGFVAQDDTIITLLEGGDASVAATDVDYKASMNLDGVTLKKGAFIVSPAGEAFQNINISEGSVLAYNSVFKGEEPGPFVGLLDLYPNASAAYSLRKLSSSYSGDAIEVRRSVGTPSNQNIGFNSDGELDTVALLAFVGSGDGFVVTWYDQSGIGNDVTQNQASKQPKIVDSGSTILKNGLPAVEFNGLSTEFDTSGFFTNQNYNVIGVGSINIDDSIMYCFGGGLTTLKTFGTSLNSVNTIGTKYGSSFLSQSYTLGEQVLLFNSYALTAYESYINSVESTNTTPAFRGGTASYKIGSVGSSLFYLDGTIQEFITYDSSQLPNREEIETNINKHYNIYWDGSQAGLLDYYPNASAAYSLRALNSNYTGPAITVRRSSDNDVQDIKLLYDGELDTEGLLSFVGSGDGFVSKWYDQSGEGVNATQGSASAQPKIVSNGSLITKGGVAAIDFDGVNDDLRITTPVLNEINISHFSVSSSNSPETIGAVLCQSHTTVETIRVLNDSRSAFTPPRNLVVTALPTTYVNSGLSVARVNTNQRLLSSFIDSSKNMAAYDNGATGGTDTYVGSVTASNGLTIGSQAGLTYLNGKVQEIILYDSNQAANRVGIETNINNFYNVY